MQLTIYDLSGIQSFIFETNILREIAGASRIAHDALFENIDFLIKDKYKDNAIKKIYVGGGNALVIFEDVITEHKFTRDLKRLAFTQSGGALRICTASIKINENISLAENQKKLMELLDKNKRTTSPVSTAKGFSINAHDSTTLETLMLFEDKITSKSSYLKRGAYKKHEDNINKLEEFTCVDDFREFPAKDSNGGVIDGAKNYLAIIHIDGNTVGKRVREYTEKLKGSFDEQLEKLGNLSKEINDIFNNVLIETVKEIYKKEKGKLPFRRVVNDGDDITVICLAKDSFNLVKTFMDKLSNHKLDSLGGGVITAGAGIAIAKFQFPFYTAYKAAEELCGNAKKKAVELGFEGENSKSSVDCHVCYGGISTDINELRRKNYQIDDYNLALRPYVFGADNSPLDFKTFYNFLVPVGEEDKAE